SVVSEDQSAKGHVHGAVLLHSPVVICRSEVVPAPRQHHRTSLGRLKDDRARRRAGILDSDGFTVRAWADVHYIAGPGDLCGPVNGPEWRLRCSRTPIVTVWGNVIRLRSGRCGSKVVRY